MRQVVRTLAAHATTHGGAAGCRLGPPPPSSSLRHASRGLASSAASHGWFGSKNANTAKLGGGLGDGEGDGDGATSLNGGAGEAVEGSSVGSGWGSWIRGRRGSEEAAGADEGAASASVTDDLWASPSTSLDVGGAGGVESIGTSGSGFDPVGLAASALETVHAASGLPWWATFACGAVAVRCALLPAAAKQAQAGALLHAAMTSRGPDGNAPKTFTAIVAAALALRRPANSTHVAWLVGAPLIQLPVFITAIASVRRLAVQPDIG